MSPLERTLAVARLESIELMRSRWMALIALLYAGMACLFVFVGFRESDVLGFTGIGRVMLSLCNLLVMLLPLLALTATAPVISRAREDGTLELIFSHPLNRAEYFNGVSLARFAALVVPMVVLLGGLNLVTSLWLSQSASWIAIGRMALVAAALTWSFVAIGLALSVGVRSQTRVTVAMLLVWVISVALLDFALIGLMLQWRLNPPTVFILAALNPVETARVALVSLSDPSLSVLGPVGFYLANRLGRGMMLAAGIVWPMALGTAVWWSARWFFVNGDLL